MSDNLFYQALNKVALFDFRAAYEDFGSLVEAYPEEEDFSSGFYGCGYWKNREDSISKLTPGRTLGSYLVNEWDRFENLLSEKGLHKGPSLAAIERAVLSKAAENYRLAFQQEGGSTKEVSLLIDLSLCLIRIHDYKNALEILHYSKRLDSGNAKILYLLAETASSMPEIEYQTSGASYYRDAFLLNPGAFDLSVVSSEPMKSCIVPANANGNEGEEQGERIAISFMIACSQMSMRKLNQEDIQYLISETNRLMKDFHTISDKFKSRVATRINFYLLCLVHHYQHHQPESELYQNLKETLLSFSEESYHAFFQKPDK